MVRSEGTCSGSIKELYKQFSKKENIIWVFVLVMITMLILNMDKI